MLDRQLSSIASISRVYRSIVMFISVLNLTILERVCYRIWDMRAILHLRSCKKVAGRWSTVLLWWAFKGSVLPFWSTVPGQVVFGSKVINCRLFISPTVGLLYRKCECIIIYEAVYYIFITVRKPLMWKKISISDKTELACQHLLWRKLW